jgi:hypothetical protein
MATPNKNRFYIIKCFDDNECFIKTGTTGSKLSRRYSGKIPYSWEVVSEIFCTVTESIAMENTIGENFYQYSPLKKFGGYLECFMAKDLNMIIEKSLTLKSGR